MSTFLHTRSSSRPHGRARKRKELWDFKERPWLSAYLTPIHILLKLPTQKSQLDATIWQLAWCLLVAIIQPIRTATMTRVNLKIAQIQYYPGVRLLFLPSKVVEYVRRLHISNHPAILNSQQPYSLPAPHHNLSTPCFFQTKTVVTDERMGILQCWICWVCIVWSVEPAARCIVYCDNLAETKKRKTVRTSYVKLLNWCLLYLTRPRNNVYIAILYLYKSYF